MDFPPIASINARSDGSAASEQKVHEANARFALQLCGRLADSSVCDGEPVLVGCSSGARAALGGDALSLRDAKQAHGAGQELDMILRWRDRDTPFG